MYKRYQQEDLNPDALAVLHRLIRWRWDLSRSERSWLDRRASWPRHVVLDDRRHVLGVLLAIAPQEFWRGQRDGSVAPRAMGALARPARSSDYEYFNLPQSMARLGHALETFTFLHEHGLVYGDLHRGNILVSGLQEVGTYLIDLDQVILEGRSPLARVEVEKYRGDHVSDWPPNLNAATDLYKFAMSAVGVLGKNAAAIGLSDQAVAALAPQHAEALERMLTLSMPDVTQIRLMAKSWQSVVTPQGEFAFSSQSISKSRWQGTTSRDRPARPAVPTTRGCPPPTLR